MKKLLIRVIFCIGGVGLPANPTRELSFFRQWIREVYRCDQPKEEIRASCYVTIPEGREVELTMPRVRRIYGESGHSARVFSCIKCPCPAMRAMFGLCRTIQREFGEYLLFNRAGVTKELQAMAEATDALARNKQRYGCLCAQTACSKLFDLLCKVLSFSKCTYVGWITSKSFIEVNPKSLVHLAAPALMHLCLMLRAFLTGIIYHYETQVQNAQSAIVRDNFAYASAYINAIATKRTEGYQVISEPERALLDQTQRLYKEIQTLLDIAV